MVGDDHVRFCGKCEKNVYNLSSLSREEAEALLVAKEGKMCVRIFRREDGTVLTDDCPVGVTKRRRRRAAVAAVGGGLMAAAAALGMKETAGARMGGIAPAETGDVVMMGEPALPPPQPTTTVQQGQWLGGAVAIPQTPQKATHTMGKPVLPRPAK